MADYIMVTVYTGPDEESRLAERIAREAQVFLAREYGIPVEVAVIRVPLSGEEAREEGIPTTLVEDIAVASGRAPLIVEIVDAVFDKIKEEHGLTEPLFDLASVEA